MFDDEPVPTKAVISLGESLDALSIADLNDRIARLQAEIERVETELDAKRNQRAAAEAVFGKA